MKKVLKFICNLDLVIAGLAFTAIVLMTVAGVFMRKVLNRPLAWLEEMQLFFFVWTVFFGSGLAFRTGNHVGIDIIAERLNPRARKILDIIVYLITIAVILYIFKGSIDLTDAVTKKVTPYFKISYWVIDIAVPIGCVLMCLQYTVLMVQNLFGKKKQEVND